MNKIQFFISLILLLASSHSFAQMGGKPHMHDQGLSIEKQVASAEGARCENLIDVSVNGLVCDFCARALEKVFGSRDDVSGIDVDLNNGKVRIATTQGANISDETLTQLITVSGYNVVKIDKGCS